MSALCSGTRAAGGASPEIALLSDAGVAALYRDGWDAMRLRLDCPGAWFVAERSLEGAPAPVVSPLEPFLIEAADADGGAAYLVYVHPGIRWFGGHFPGRPILPGVAQIDWAARRGGDLGFAGQTFTGLSGIKFAAPVAPGAVLALTLTSPRPGRLAFVLESAEGVHSRGTLHYRM